ncbi:hypothetical protein BDN70DRAFT_821763, partial [Pholiota conissans]
FQGEEFAWCDSAYPVTTRTISIHKKPASLRPENAVFDTTASHLRVRSEHCNGSLKGRFQSLRGLRVAINRKRDHVRACQWVSASIIIHNLVIDVEGGSKSSEFLGHHSRYQEFDDRGYADVPGQEDEDGNAKRRRLIAELVAFKGM